MGQSVPVLIALYWNKRDGRTRVAEFHLNAGGWVELTVLDPAYSLVPRDWYDHGVDFVAEGRTVLPADGSAFMRALLQPFRMTYWTLVDESPSPPEGEHTVRSI